MFLNKKNTYTYTNKDTEVKFLLGGIGTGNISLDSRGHFSDYEIYNEPSKNRNLPYSFFSINIFDKEKQYIKVLEANLSEPHKRPLGYFSSELAGLPRFNSSKMRCKYPFANVELIDDEIPVKVEMIAYTPFIPLDSKSSGIPGFYIKYKVKNKLSNKINVSICGSFANPVAFNGFDLFNNMQHSHAVKNEFLENDNYVGIHYKAIDMPIDERYYGDMFFATPEKENVTAKPNWLTGAWWDGAHDFWNDFKEDGKLDFVSKEIGIQSEFNSLVGIKIGSISVNKTLDAGEEKEFTFILGWRFPNRANRWEGHLLPTIKNKEHKTVRNYYSYLFDDAIGVVDKLFKNSDYYFETTKKFTDALYNSTLPIEVIDAIGSNITTLRSPTCFRMGEEGTFLGWEGCFEHKGSCEGNCTHVYNYAQTIAFLFPDLEQNMRNTEFLKETDEIGKMSFRSNWFFEDPKWNMIPATDGQLGCILKLYRDWMLSGNNQLLYSMWDKVKLSLDFARKYWINNDDGVLNARQHNTYDIEFYGLSSLTNSIYLAALKAAIKMAQFMNDDIEEIYQDAFNKCQTKLDKELWNGEYYKQKIDDVDKYKYQYGEGCLSDQILGQQFAYLYGLGNILPEEHIKKAIYSVYKYNFKEKLNNHENVQRTYGLNDESGLVLCSWPKGGRPRFPFVYADEVWSGVEYQVATNLIYEGYVEEALKIVKAVRQRYNGKNRNPFNEVECGNHYIRSMASFGLLIALSGYKFNLVKNEISFSPKINKENFKCFFINAKGWGVFEKKLNNEKINYLYKISEEEI